MLFSPFFSEKRHEHSLVNKTIGLAKIAGLVAGGLYLAGPTARKIAGTVAINAAKSIAHGEFRMAIDGNSVESSLGHFFLPETNLFISGEEQIERTLTTAGMKAHRIGNLLDSIEGYVGSESTASFADVKEDLMGFLGQVGEAGKDISNLEDKLLHPDALRAFNNKARSRGIIFEDSFYRNQDNIFRSVLRENMSLNVERAQTAAFMNQDASRRALTDAITAARQFHVNRTDALHNMIDYGEAKHITFGDLEHAVANKLPLAGHIDTFFTKAGVRAKKDKTVSQEIVELAQRARTSLFGIESPEGGITHHEEAAELHALLKATKTGLMQPKSGEVVSIAHLKHAKDKFTDQLLDKFQLPLVPYLFNVPLKTFKFLSQAKEAIIDFGTLLNNPEFRRQGIGRGFEQGIGVGNNLLKVDPISKLITLHEGKVIAFRHRDSARVKTFADIRDNDVKNFLHTLTDFHGSETAHSKATSFLYNNQHRFLNLHAVIDIHNPDSSYFAVTPKDKKYNLLVKKLYPTGRASVTDLHPNQLAEFLHTSGHVTDTEGNILGTGSRLVTHSSTLYEKALRHIIKEGSQARVDHSEFIKSAWHHINEGLPFHRGSYDAHLMHIMQDIDDPHKVIAHINSEMDGSDISSSNLLKNASDQFHRVINSIKLRPQDLVSKAEGEGGILHKAQTALLGKAGPSQLMEELQSALVTEIVRGRGLETLGRSEIKDSASRDILSIYRRLKEGQLSGVSDLALSEKLAHLGYRDHTGKWDVEELTRFINQFVHGEKGNEKVDPTMLAKLGSATLEDPFKLSTNGFTHAKILKEISQSIEDLNPHIEGHTREKQLDIIHQLSLDAGLIDTLKERFSYKAFSPEVSKLNPLNDIKYFGVPSAAPDLFEFLMGDMEQKRSIAQTQIARKFGIPDYLQSMVDPNKALGVYGLATTLLMQMPQELGNTVGLGLNAQDRLTTLRSTLGYYGKRVLPLMIGYEAYKNLNANAHDNGMPGLDDLGANTIANVNIASARFKDAFGITKINKDIVGALPGLDQYFHPRTEKEYKEYLHYGNEEIRQGRLWLIGNRNSLTGDQLTGFRPNFYRRWKSHWTEAENVDIADPAHSFLPSLSHPLAPINLLFNPHWWEEKHSEDRPYPGFGHHHSYVEGQTFTTINSTSAFGPLSIGSFGGGYPTSMTGGGYPLTIGQYNPGGNPADNRPFDSGNTARVAAGFGGSGSRLSKAGEKIRLGLHKGISYDDIEHNFIKEKAVDWIEGARTQMGLFGAVMQRMPFYPETDLKPFQKQDPGATRSFAKMMWQNNTGEILGAPGEFFRRFITGPSQSYDAYNPEINNMPDWIKNAKPGLGTGDPYARIANGEMLLPGDAFNKLNSWVKPLKVRGSVLGGTEEEIIRNWLDPAQEIDDQQGQDIVGFGSLTHLKIQRQLEAAGLLVAAEVPIYDDKNNISGTIDAIVKGPQGLEIIDIKTQGGKKWGETPDKYIDQITAYMAMTGIKKASLEFVNRDNMAQTRKETFDFDPSRWQAILDRIGRARDAMNQMVEDHKISPFETYDLISRIEVLSKVAPDSAEFKKYVKFAQDSGGLGGFEAQRFEQALKEADKLNHPLRLYPRKYGVATETHREMVESINDDGTITTQNGTIKLAGVKFDKQAFKLKDPADIFAEYGIKIGSKISVTKIKGQFSEETSNDLTLDAIVGNVNGRLINSDIAQQDDEDRSPLASQVIRGNSVIGELWEKAVHTDNLATNKLLRTRTALEQFKRGEIFGTDRSKWDDPFHNFIEPTLTSFIAKDPISAAIQTGIATSIFVAERDLRSKVFVIGASFGAGVSVLRKLAETITHSKWVPHKAKKQGEFDEYWDTLKYLKYSAIANAAKKKAKKEEGIDIDELEESQTREIKGLGPWATVAIDAERKAKSTMYGFDQFDGSLQEAISAIPKRQQQIAEDIVQYGSLKEKQEFYNLLPNAQKRVLGKFLNANINDLPKKPNLSTYFKHHFLPSANWKGYSNLVSDTDLETRAADDENLQIEKPNKIQVSKARAYTNGISIPRMDHPTFGDIRGRINEILAGGFSGVTVNYNLRPSNYNHVNVDMSLFQDQTSELVGEMRNHMRR